MTTGSYVRDLRVSTPGKYSGPYLCGLRSTKNWSGTNYPSGKPLRTNVVKEYVDKFRYKTIKIVRYVPVKYTYWKYTRVQGSRPARYVKTPVTGIRFKRVVTRSQQVIAYKKRIPYVYQRPPKRARIEEHPYNSSWSEFNGGIINYTYPGVGNFSNEWFGSQAGLNIAWQWTSNDDLKLSDKLREKVAGSDFNAGIALAESHKTLQLIANAAIRIRKGLQALKGGNMPEAFLQLAGHLKPSELKGKKPPKQKTIQQNWLELQYGWRPLLNDVYGATHFLAHQLNVPIQQTVRVRREQPGIATWSGGNFQMALSVCITRKSIKAIIKEKDIPTLVGLTNPSAILWEAVPYSFVVDWFIPIGSYLSARGLSQALTGTFVTSTKQWEQHSGAKITGPLTNVSFSGNANPTIARGTFSRTVSSTLQIPLPSWKPLMKVASWQHCANAVALLTSRK